MRCHHSDLDMLKRCAEQRRPVFHLCHAGKAVAATIMRLMEQPELMEKAKAEHKAKVGSGYVCPLPDGLKPGIC